LSPLPSSPDSMPEWLQKRAAISPQRLALIAGAEKWSYAELNQLVSAWAQRLVAAGIKDGDRVALLAKNGGHFVQLAHAVPRMGGVFAPLNTRLTASEWSRLVDDLRPALLIHDETQAAKAGGLKKELPELRCLSFEELGHYPGDSGKDANIGESRIDLAAVHSIIYTSGTVEPKGTMLTYGNHFWNAVGSALNLGLHSDDRWLACLPLYHVGGLTILLRSVIYGTTAVVHESFDPAAVNRTIDEEGITIVSMVSEMLTRTLADRGERPFPPTLRQVLLGGGPVPLPLLEVCASRGLPVVQTYGLTEAASQAATLAPEDASHKLGSAGKPLLPTEIRIMGDDGSLLPPGEPGEIVVRGPTVTPGYFNRPEENELVLRGGWLHTDDIGYLDDEGYLYVLDRRDDLIISGGENVYPAEVEAVLESHPAVLEAGVTSYPDERWGQMVAATVKLREEGTICEEELLAFCAERLASYKFPTRLRFTKELPRNAVGKLLRRVLREEWSRA